MRVGPQNCVNNSLPGQASNECSDDSTVITPKLMNNLIMKSKPTPTHECRIGTIKAAIWANPSAKGPFYNVTFSRLFKEGNGWKFADNFGRDDLLPLAKVADIAHTWICDRLHRENAPESGDSSAKQ